MQGSFWKTVAVVGVIGIGGLAILEVQQRLDQRTAEMQPVDADALAQQILAQGETSVEAELTNSDFDQMMADSQTNPGQFDSLTEPQADQDDSMATAFVGTEPVDAQQNTPPVNTEVRSENLAQGGNPFENFSLGQPNSNVTLAANYQTSDAAETVEPVAFTEEQPPTFEETETSTAQPPNLQPFRREGVAQPEPEPASQEEFPLFGATPPASNPKPAAAATLKSIPEQTNAAGMRFFAGHEAESQEPETKQTAQFYTNEADAPAFNDSSTPAGRTQPEPQFEPFPDDTFTRDYAPEARPEPVADNGPLFENDPAATQTREFAPGFDADAPALDNSPPANRVEEPDPMAPGSGSLPFVEDVPATDVPTLESDSPILSIPTPDRRTVPLPEPDRSFDLPRQPLSDSAPRDDRSLRSDSDDLILNRGNSSSPFSEDMLDAQSGVREFNSESSSGIPRNDVRDRSNSREFNSGPREFNSDSNFDSRGVREFGSDPRDTNLNGREFDPGAPGISIQSRENQNQPYERNNSRQDLNNGSREFGSDSHSNNGRGYPSDSRSRDLNLDRNRNGNSIVNRRGDIRQVSGVMRPNLVLEKEAPKNATVGTPIDYNIYVKNEGDATAYEVVVEDEVTAGARVEAASPAASRNRQTNKLVWEFAQIPPNETKKITVRVTPTGEGMLDGVASVKFKARVQATTIITAPKLHIEMTGPEEVRLGEEVTYRYVITNEGSGEARDVFVRTLLPSSGGLKHPAGRDLEYEIDALKPAEQREIVLAVVAAEAGPHRAQAEVSAAGGAKDQAIWETNIIGAQLKIDRRGPKRRFVGRSGVYENIVSNETNFEAVDAKVIEQVPEGMRFVSANKGGDYNAANRTVTWRLNRLGAGKVETLQVELMPVVAGPRESIVTVFENAGIRSEDYVSTTQVEDLHNVSADISQLDGPVAVGETFGFTISIDNRGTADATDVELSVSVPAEIKVVGAGSREIPAKLLDGNQVQYNLIVRIEPNRQQEFELKLQGAQPIRNGVVKASVRYKQMSEPLVISESVTVYRDEL